MKWLLASDGSQNGVEAARYIAGLQVTEKPSVTLLTVAEEIPSESDSSRQSWLPEFQTHVADNIARHHHDVSQILADAGIPVTTVQRTGHARQVILDEAKRIGGDLIVLGARGHSTLNRLLLGSVSDHIANHAKCSVLVVRPGKQENHVSPPKSIAIAYDDSAGSREAVVELMELGLSRELQVHVISVVPAMDLYTEPFSAMIEERETREMDRRRLISERIASRIASQFPNTDARVTKGRHVGDTIVMMSEENGDDLIVVGDTGHGWLGEWILGSTTKYVLRHAPCSVWVSRHHRKTSTSPDQTSATGPSS